MSLLGLLSKIFNNGGEDKFEFRKTYDEDTVKIEILKNNKKISLSKFNQKEYEYLLKTDIFQVELNKEALELPYENIYVLDEESIEYLGLPKYFMGTLKIENNTNFLNQNGVKFKIDFEDSENRYIYQYKNLITREKDGKRYFLKEKDFYLAQDILSYNNNSEKNKLATEQYRIVEKIKRLKEQKEIILGSDIKRIGDIQLIDSLELDFQEKDENKLEVIPVLKSLEGALNKDKITEEFKKEFKNINGLKKIYTLKIDNKEYEVILNNELLEALQVVKENKSEISKESFLKKEDPIFSDERMNIENLDYNYGPRVKGLGFLNYRATPAVNNSDIEWFSFEFPYIDTTDGEQIKLKPKDIKYLEEKSKELSNEDDETLVDFETDEGNKSLFLKKKNIQDEILKIKNSCKEIIDFKKAKDMKNILELMKKSDDEYVEYKGCYVKKVNDIDYVESLIKEKEIKEGLDASNEEKKKVLILKDNIDELEHAEDIKKQNKEFTYEQPISLKPNINLMPYQKEGVGIMQGLYNDNPINGVLLSDDMGLGKTLQILTFLAWLKEKNRDFKGLIVVPTSLINNWYNESLEEKNKGEIQKFFLEGTFKVEILKGKLEKEKLEKIKETNLLILSYETLRINHIELGKIEWDVMVCDEAQKIKNPKTLLTTAVKVQNVKFKIACSATPIENTILDLWCLVDFANPGLLGSLKDFKKKYFIKEANQETLEDINNSLKDKLGYNFLRRTKDVLNSQGKEFPKKIVVYKHSIYSEKQKEILNTFNQMKLAGESVLPLIQGMIMACSHPELIDKKNNFNLNIPELENESLKLLNVKEILEVIKSKEEKVIIFTKYRKMQKIISVLVKEWCGFNPSIINGDDSSDIRRKILDEYRESKGFNVIILSPEAAGVGLNIVEANHVIHYTRHWNPAKEEQASDRAYRIGQTKDVYVYYPIVSSEANMDDLTFYNIDDWIESNDFNFLTTSSPEEKLNKIILKKKKLLRNFFLAAPIDLDLTDFEEFKTSNENKENYLTIENIDILNWDYLEAIAVALLEKEYNGTGYLTRKTKDFGVDGLIEIGDNRYIAIQVKKSKNIVGSNAIEEVLYGKNIYEKELKMKISKIAVVTNSNTTDTLKAWESENIEIIDRKKISILLQKYKLTLKEIENKLL